MQHFINVSRIERRAPWGGTRRQVIGLFFTIFYSSYFYFISRLSPLIPLLSSFSPTNSAKAIAEVEEFTAEGGASSITGGRIEEARAADSSSAVSSAPSVRAVCARDQAADATMDDQTPQAKDSNQGVQGTAGGSRNFLLGTAHGRIEEARAADSLTAVSSAPSVRYRADDATMDDRTPQAKDSNHGVQGTAGGSHNFLLGTAHGRIEEARAADSSTAVSSAPSVLYRADDATMDNRTPQAKDSNHGVQGTAGGSRNFLLGTAHGRIKEARSADSSTAVSSAACARDQVADATMDDQTPQAKRLLTG
jgi:hypothetical protein